MIGRMIPSDAPLWYFLLWGQGLNMAVSYAFAAYMAAHGLFLRL